ncbi:MAG: AIR synthase-related protein, partial [Candidatus Omnitrophota bacterium]
KQEVITKTCEHFRIDPYSAISEGTLIAMVDPKEAGQVVSAFRENNILSSVIGEVTGKKDGLKITKNGLTFDLEYPKTDPYWIIMEELSKESVR